MSWVTCPSCKGSGEIEKFWGKDNPQIKCPSCKGSKSLGIIPAISMNQDWMPEKDHDRWIALRKAIQDDHSEHAHEIKLLMDRCQLLWKKMCIMLDYLDER